MTLNIAYYVDSVTFGGSEQALLHLLSHLDRTRWRPVLIHHPEPELEPLLVQAKRLEVRCRDVPRMQGPRALRYLPQFIQLLRAEKPVIFHAQLSWLLSCKFGLLAASAVHVPRIMATLQQFLLPPWRSNIYWQQRIVAANVHQYIAVSRAVARQLSQSFHVPSRKIKLIYNAIPFASFHKPAAQRPGIAQHNESRRPIVLTVARLDAQKGHKFLLDAITRIPEANFLLAGSGVEQTALEARARELGIFERVVFLGHRTDVPDLLANCDLFVLPSLYEGFPLSILEAMAAGKPVVATAVGGTPEAVIDGETGYLVPSGDEAALSSAIRKVLSDPVLAYKMGLAGRERAQKLFAVDAMAQHYSKVYEDLLSDTKINEPSSRQYRFTGHP